MKSKSTVILSALFVVSLATAGYLVAKGHRVQGKQAFTLTISQTAYPVGHPPILSAVQVRYQNQMGAGKLKQPILMAERMQGSASLVEAYIMLMTRTSG